MKTVVQKLIVVVDGGERRLANIRDRDGTLMLNKLLNLLERDDCEVKIPNQLVWELATNYKKKSRQLRRVKSELRDAEQALAKYEELQKNFLKLSDEREALLAEVEDLCQELVNAECAYDQLEYEYQASIRDQDPLDD